ncbi:hypothetical protein OGH69_14555 [Flavobacterium sp. MFBS3-15]|uniref:hypothetical protein n=1 Tax=Flavobacterium sp. MFBS3-15 TaxID=2989816 RepID=UPI002236BB6A|nr:hypothetical protein [Flavobacterium sp. MFBS3-15]MCW4470196.1 hypothetical protein [Flavobacterium sp. MFBS3-15]
MKNVVSVYAREIDFDLELNIEFLGVRMITGAGKELLGKHNKEVASDTPHLVIILQNHLEVYESVNDGAAYSRPKLLIAFGVLSFFTQEVFTPFETIMCLSYVGDYTEEFEERFLYEGVDLLKDFHDFKVSIDTNNDNEFIYSILDRWRKGLYLENESAENMLYDDETLLSYFHILEMLTTKYEDKQKSDIKIQINEFSKSLYEEVFLFEGNHLNNEVNIKRRLLQGLILPDLSVSSKIFYMFKEQGILTYRLKSFISEFVKDRNLVAHGGQVYQDRVIFPVPPFFPLIKNSKYPKEFYRILTAKAIATYIGLDIYSGEWEEVAKNIIPTLEELKQFQNEGKYIALTNKEFCAGKINDITPLVISHYLILKKIRPKEALKILTPFIYNYTASEEETFMIIWVVIIILEILDQGELREKCIEIIRVAEQNNWHPSFFKMRDEMYTLEYLGFEIKQFKELIKTGVIR